MTAFLTVALMMAASAVSVLWLAQGASGLIWLTRSLIDFCQSLYLACVEYSGVFNVFALWAGAILAASGISYSAVKTFRATIKAKMALKGLSKKELDSLVLIDDRSAKTAFTYGLIRPRIYLSRGLIREFTPKELRAILYHELHHRKRLHPLKFFLAGVLSDALFFIPAVRHILQYLILKKENEADIYAASRMNEPYTLAGAIIKAAQINNQAIAYAPSIAGGIGIEKRVSALIEGGKISRPKQGFKTIILSAAASALLVLTLSLPISYAYMGSSQCTLEHCSLHIDKLGQRCKTHCDTHRHS